VASHLLGIDIGTTATKGILLHPGRGIVAEAEAPATLRSPRIGWAEEDPAEWWSNVAGVTQACISQAGLGPADIAAVGVSGMVPTLILLDAAGNVLRPSIQQNDVRSVQEILDFRAEVGEAEVLERTGSAITQQSIGPKLLWLSRNEPTVMEPAAHLLGSYDYIVYRLTGFFSCERNWALESGLFDLNREDWDDSLLALSGINRDQLGTVHWPSEVVGQVTPEAAQYVGLAEGTPVVAGSADHIASAFSAGLKDPGDLLVKLGGAGDILFSLDELMLDPRLFLDYHVIPGKYLINGCMAASGSIIKWFRQGFAPDTDYRSLDAGAAAIPAGSDGLILLPYFLGEKTPVNDPLARGILFGLTLSHSRDHIYRAILEGISFGFRHHLAILAERGLIATKARVTNGGARSTLWKQITADVLNLPLEQIDHHPGSSFGAAFVAGKGVGIFDDWADIDRFINIAAVVEPDRAAHARYETLFVLYLELYLRNRDLFEKIS
jgi:xylulokinase